MVTKVCYVHFIKLLAILPRPTHEEKGRKERTEASSLEGEEMGPRPPRRKYCFAAAVAAAAEGEKTRRGMLSKPPSERAAAVLRPKMR